MCMGAESGGAAMTTFPGEAAPAVAGSGGATAGGLGNMGLFMQIAGLATSAFGAYSQGKADKAATEQQAAVTRNNEMLAQWQAADALRRGKEAEQTHRFKVASMKGSQRASFAARGLDIGEGSAFNILADTDYMGERDAITIRNNASREAWGHTVSAKNAGSNADLLEMRARNTNPATGAFTTLLTGAGQVAASWYKRSTAGTPSVFSS